MYIILFGHILEEKLTAIGPFDRERDASEYAQAHCPGEWFVGKLEAPEPSE